MGGGFFGGAFLEGAFLEGAKIEWDGNTGEPKPRPRASNCYNKD